MTPILVCDWLAQTGRAVQGRAGDGSQQAGTRGSQSMDDRDVRGLLARYAASRDPADREQLILLNLGLVTRLARRYAWRGQELDDLVQVGAIGLMNAIDRYDPVTTQGGLVAFAVPCILGEIRRYFRDKSASVRLPRRLWELRSPARRHRRPADSGPAANADRGGYPRCHAGGEPDGPGCRGRSDLRAVAGCGAGCG